MTLPTREMREAMANAALGDDVLGDDPTVQHLEDLAAARMGHEAAVFVPSGTMGNQIALCVHCSRGDAAIFEDEAHMIWYEAGGPAVHAGVITRTIKGENGVIPPEALEGAFLERSEHTPGVTALCIENTHNRAGGAVTPPQTIAQYRAFCDEKGIALHLDGARVFNAAVALGCEVSEIASPFDSVSFCLSKGLSAPVGSVLCGSAEFIANARYWRKRMGGGMRQAGLLAACGIVALNSMVERLADDHARARRLAEALDKLPGLSALACPTNILIVETDAAAQNWSERLKEEAVLCFPFGPNKLRLVTHRGIDDAGLAAAINAFHRLAAEMSEPGRA